MPGTDLTALNNVLKTVYGPWIGDTYHKTTRLMSMMKPTPAKQARGATIVGLLNYLPISSITQQSYGDTNLPDANATLRLQWSVDFKSTYARVQFTGPAIDAAMGKEASYYTDPIRNEMDNIRNSIGYLGHRCMWVGASGFFAQPATFTSTTQFTVSDARNLRYGDTVDILLTATGSAGQGVVNTRVTDVNGTTVTIETAMSAGITAATASDYGVYWHRGYNNMRWGIPDIISSSDPAAALGNYGGIDRDAYSWWKAQVKDVSGLSDTTLRPRFIQETLDLIDKNAFHGSDGAACDVIFCDHDTFNYLIELTRGDVRYQPSAKQVELWNDAINFNGTPIVKDKHCPANEMYFFNFKDWLDFYSPGSGRGRWGDRDGTILRQVTNADEFTGYWYSYGNLFCQMPNRQAKLTGYTLPTTS